MSSSDARCLRFRSLSKSCARSCGVNESRIVISASPLIFLAAIDALELLPRLVDQVLLPEAVLGEVLAKAEPRLSLQILSSTAWVRIEPDVAVPEEVASWDLGAGETQVLAFGRSRGGVELVLDDRQIRMATAL